MSWDHDSTRLQNLIVQFRSVHPTASFITDVLTIYDDAYVVRASIHIDGQCLATGLSSAVVVEQAEDQAQWRALRSLGFQLPFPQSDTAVNTSTQPTEFDRYLPSDLTNSHPSNGDAQNISAQPSPTQPVDLPDRSSLSPSVGTDSAISPSSAHPQRPAPTPKLHPTPATAFPVDNFDRSDDIAKILVEMKRIGWSREQGRDHLRKVYGKETRQELSDEELLDFLSFLESQSP